MTARPKLAPEQQLTIEEFLAFTDTRPEGERWELIEGVAVLNPSPVEHHQVVVLNIVHLSDGAQAAHRSELAAHAGRGHPRADLAAQPAAARRIREGRQRPPTRPVTDDALVLFEVLSRSNTKADQAWRRKVYASVPNCRHYVTVSLKAVEVDAYDRDSGWKRRTISNLADALALPALGLSIPLADIYRWTPLGQGMET